jgi:peptidoglycan/xylan/chitin deacetylase (PgdA/CDA1 family)
MTCFIIKNRYKKLRRVPIGRYNITAGKFLRISFPDTLTMNDRASDGIYEEVHASTNRWTDLLPHLRESDPRLWDRYTLAEEYSPQFLDRYGRLPSPLRTSGLLVNPEVSRTLVDRGFSPAWPDDHSFALCLTHDIDSITTPLLGNFWQGVRGAMRGDVRSAARHWQAMVARRRDPLRNLDEIMELEESFGARSTFFLLALTSEDADYAYPVDELVGDCRNALERGFEIGLHGGHDAHHDPETLSREKIRLERAIGRSVSGYRNHYLRFSVPETWSLLADAGFVYDSTLGYADCVGFRNGCCHPFRPFDRRTGAEVDLMELPLVIMDRTLEHMDLEPETSRTLVRYLVDQVAACRGVMTVLWHNQQLSKESEKAAYMDLLSYARDRGAWLTTGESIVRWWRSHVLD